MRGDGDGWVKSHSDPSISSGPIETGLDSKVVVDGSSLSACTPAARFTPKINSTVLLFLVSKSSFLFFVWLFVRNDSSTLFLRFLAACKIKSETKPFYNLWSHYDLPDFIVVNCSHVFKSHLVFYLFDSSKTFFCGSCLVCQYILLLSRPPIHTDISIVVACTSLPTNIYQKCNAILGHINYNTYFVYVFGFS